MTLTPDQEKGVEELLSGRDVVAALPTGSGKSLIFQSLTYSAVKRGLNSVTVIVTPLKAISFTHVRTFREKVSCCIATYFVNIKFFFISNHLKT